MVFRYGKTERLGFLAALVAGVFILAPGCSARGVSREVGRMELSTTSVTLTTLYDNYLARPGLQTRHGFSCLVEADGQELLFDTGGEGDVLLANADRLGVDLKKVRLIVLSHAHGDHTGGLGAVLARNHNVDVWVLGSFPERIKRMVRSAGARLHEVGGPEAISPAVATTGEMGGWIKEQSLLVNTPEGVVVVTGCAHPGIVRIVERAGQLTGRKVHLVLGGFHLMGEPERRLRDILSVFRRLGVEKVAPCHCSGDRMRALAAAVYGKDYVANGVGMVVRVGEDASRGK